MYMSSLLLHGFDLMPFSQMPLSLGLFFPRLCVVVLLDYAQFLRYLTRRSPHPSPLVLHPAFITGSSTWQFVAPPSFLWVFVGFFLGRVGCEFWFPPFFSGCFFLPKMRIPFFLRFQSLPSGSFEFQFLSNLVLSLDVCLVMVNGCLSPPLWMCTYASVFRYFFFSNPSLFP